MCTCMCLIKTRMNIIKRYRQPPPFKISFRRPWSIEYTSLYTHARMGRVFCYCHRAQASLVPRFICVRLSRNVKSESGKEVQLFLFRGARNRSPQSNWLRAQQVERPRQESIKDRLSASR